VPSPFDTLLTLLAPCQFYLNQIAVKGDQEDFDASIQRPKTPFGCVRNCLAV
jgi:hypothetical protein